MGSECAIRALILVFKGVSGVLTSVEGFRYSAQY